MKKAHLVEIITYFFILLFLYTGVSKLMEMSLFKQQLESSPLMDSMAGIISWTLPIGEIVLAITLFIPPLRLSSLYATLVLMSLFTIYVVILLFIDNHLSCSCGGVIEQLSPRQHVFFNGACVLLSAVGIATAKRQPSPERIKWLPITSVIFLFVFIGWTLFSAFITPTVLKTGMEGRSLASFDLLLPDSVTHFNTANIPTGKPFIIIGFDPFCSHCQAETAEILKNIDQFRNTSIYFVTPYELWKVKAFYRHFKLGLYSNITIGKDYQNAFFRQYMVKMLPYTSVFDSQKRLKQVFASQTDAKSLAKALQE